MNEKELTVNDVFSGMSEEKKQALYFAVGAALEGKRKTRKGIISFCSKKEWFRIAISKNTDNEDLVMIFFIEQALMAHKAPVKAKEIMPV